jgi:protein-L-isoaspartate(D-aspartate) O-methyltransferase
MATRAACILLLLLPPGDLFSGEREQMVREQLEARGIRDSKLLGVMRTVPRHLFVPPALRSQAYADHALPIGYGATISQPYIVAWMTELLQPVETNRVLEIGTGSGYQAAVLSRLVRSVYTMEIVPELARSAAKRLEELGCHNVAVREGNGSAGWAEQGPFDRILVTAAPEEIPKALLSQLAPGGRLIAPVGTGFAQRLTVVEKTRSGTLQISTVGEVAFVPMVPVR